MVQAKAKPVEADFEGVSSSGGRRIHVPEGDYLLRGRSLEYKQSTKKNDMWVLTFTFENGPKTGREIGDNLVLVKQSMFRLKNLLEAMGYTVPDGKMKIDPNKIIAALKKKPIGAQIADDDPYEGHTPSTIKRYIPASEVEDTPDADEDADDEDVDEEEWDEDEDDLEDEEDLDDDDEEDDLDDEDEDEEGEWDEDSLGELELVELRKVAKEFGVALKKGKRSATYIKEILEAQNGGEDEEEEPEEEEEVEEAPAPKPRPKKKAAAKKTPAKKTSKKSSVTEELEDLDLDDLG